MLADPEIAQFGIVPFLRRRNLGAPDGRPLRFYRVTDRELASMQQYVRNHDASGMQWLERDCAALVLLLSEWTASRARRFHGFWNDAADDLEVPLRSQDRYQRLARGLRFWRRPSPSGERRRWLATLVREGGFPEALATKGFGALLEGLLRRFGWVGLEEAAGSLAVEERLVQFLREEAPRLAAMVASDEAIECFLDLLVELAAYRCLLAEREALPRTAEEVQAWHDRLEVGLRPEQHLPIRDFRNGIFLELLFPALDRAVAPSSPISMKMRWPDGQSEPDVVITIAGEGISRGWVASLDDRLAASPRITLAPLGAMNHGVVLEAHGDVFRPAELRWSWPIHDVQGRTLVLARRLYSGTLEIPTGIAVPRASHVVADQEGRVTSATQLVAGLPWRIWVAGGATVSEGNAQSFGARTFEVQGEAGAFLRLEPEGSSAIDFAFVNSPLQAELTGRRWRSGKLEGPFVGAPEVHVASGGRVEGAIDSHDFVQLQGGPSRFRLPAVGQPGPHVLRVRRGASEAVARFAMVPDGTSFHLARPNGDGARVLTIESSGLERGSVLEEDGREIATADADGDGRVIITVPGRGDSRKLVVDLLYDSGTRVRAPLADTRRRLTLQVDGVEFQLTGAEQSPPRIERGIARFGTLFAVGFAPRETISVCVGTTTRRDRAPRRWVHRPLKANEDGEVALPFERIASDLDRCARHVVEFAAKGNERWRLEVDDTVFVEEPKTGEPYGATLPSCPLQGPLTWRWLPAAYQWQPAVDLPMREAEGLWYPPEFELPPGGILAAPFEHERRVGYIRYIEGPPLPEAEHDSFVLALARRDGLTFDLLRREFDSGKVARRRLVTTLENLGTLEGSRSLLLTSLSEIDGALPAYAGMTGTECVENHTLRAVPAGTWLRACRATLDDTGEWLTPLGGVIPEGPVLAGVLAHAGLEIARDAHEEVSKLVHNLRTELPGRGRRATAAGDLDVAGPALLHNYAPRLRHLLLDWRKGNRAELHQHLLDQELRPYFSPPGEVQKFIARVAPGADDLLSGPLTLATIAARIVLDPTMSAVERAAARRLLLASRQTYAWTMFEPLVGALHLFSLCVLLGEFLTRFPSAALARRQLEQMEVA